jgi:hypothetical protein
VLCGRALTNTTQPRPYNSRTKNQPVSASEAHKPLNMSIGQLSSLIQSDYSPGKRLGMFAKQNIPAGHRLMTSKCIMSFDIPDSWRAAVATAPAPIPAIHILRAWLGLQNTLHSELFFYLSRESPEDPLSLGLDATRPEDLDPILRALINDGRGAAIAAAFHNNAFEFRTANGQRQLGFFPLACRFNHSCRLNAHKVWDPDQQQYVIHAVRDINAGEEITIQYVQVSFETVSRAFGLLFRYGFTCRCEVCSLVENAYVESDLRRARIHALSTSTGAEQSRRAPNMGVTLTEMYREGIQLMSAEGMVVERIGS